MRYLGFLILTSYFLLQLLLSSCSTYRVIHVTDVKQEKLLKKHGFYYNLPQTALKIDVTVKQNHKIKGPYSEYAEKFLGIRNAIKENSFNYNIVNVGISSFVQRDPEQFYFVQTSHFIKKHRAILVNLTKDGLIESINYHDRFLNPAIKQGRHNVNMPKGYEDIQSVIDGNVKEKIDTIVEKISGNDTVMIEKKTLKKIFVEKSSEQKAKESADYLMKIKADKYALLTGISEVTYSKETMEYMIDQLTKQEQEYLALFTGDTASSFIHCTFTYLPKNAETVNETVLFMFSAKDGILKNNNSGGEPIILKINKNEETTLVNKFQSQLNNPGYKKNGFFYRIPESAKVVIFKGTSVLTETNLPISQFGIISHLPVNIKKALFYPNSGALKLFAD